MKKALAISLIFSLLLGLALVHAENEYGDVDMPGGDVSEDPQEDGIISPPVTVDGTSISLKGKNNFEFEENGQIHEIVASLDVKSLKVGEVDSLVAILSNGQTQEIKILPTQAAETAKEKLRIAKGVENIIIEEENHKNAPRAVYHFNSEKTGKMLGLWKIKARYEASIDAETGEILSKNTPWWSFLLTGEGREFPEDNY